MLETIFRVLSSPSDLRFVTETMIKSLMTKNSMTSRYFNLVPSPNLTTTDAGLELLQIRCFDAPLQPQALADVKSIVQRNVEYGVIEDGLTLEGSEHGIK